MRIVFIHGMFQNPVSWEQWISLFRQHGHTCEAPAWPLHEGLPADLRSNPSANLGDLGLEEIIESISTTVTASAETPLLVGHSVGGLIAQVLVSRGLAKAGICISSVAPNKMLSFDWGFLKNSTLINNPLKGNAPFYTDLDTFHSAFCNTMSMEETRDAFERTATHDSRNVLRDCLGSAGTIDVEKPHAPLLFLAGDEDAIIPSSLSKRNAAAYSDQSSVADFQSFPGRGHFICGQGGWEEVANVALEWIDTRLA